MSQAIISSAKELLDYALAHPDEMESRGVDIDEIQALYNSAIQMYPQEEKIDPQELLKIPEFNPQISQNDIPQTEAVTSSTAVESILNKPPLDRRLFKVKDTKLNVNGSRKNMGVIQKKLVPTESNGHDWDTSIINDKKILETLQTPILMTRDMTDEEIEVYAKKTKEKKELEKQGYSLIDIDSDDYSKIKTPDSIGDPLRRGIVLAQTAVGAGLNTIPLVIQSPQLKWIQTRTNQLLQDEIFIDETKTVENRYEEARRKANAEFQMMAIEGTLPDNVKDALKDRDDLEDFFYNTGKEIGDFWAEWWDPKEATGEYAEPPENFLGYLDPVRMYMVGAETAPMMGMFVATTIANPIAGTATMFAIEAGSSKEGILEYEKTTGKRVPEELRNTIPILVGSFNAVLEKFGLDRVMKGAGVRSRLLNILVGAISEGTTEGFQEVSQIIGEQLTQEEKKLFKFTEQDWERTVASFYAGTIMGTAGTTISNTLDVEGRLVHDMQKEVDKYASDNDMSKNDSWNEVNRAVDNNEIDSDMGTWIKHFLIKNPDFDKSSVLAITKETRILLKDEYIQNLIENEEHTPEEAEDAYRIWAESEQLGDTKAPGAFIKGSTKIDTDLRKIVLSLYGGADKTTVIEEMYGALYKGLTAEERKAVEDEFRENNPDRVADLDNELKRNNGWSQLLNEHFQKRGLKWYQEEGVKINQDVVDRALTRFGQKIKDFFIGVDEVSPLGDKTMEFITQFGQGTKGISEIYSTKDGETMQAEVLDYSNKLSEIKESDPRKYWSVDNVPPESKGTPIETERGVAFVGEDGDIKGLASKVGAKEGGIADELLEKAIEAGGNKLDNFDIYLTEIYERNGFRVVARTPFNEEFAPDGWEPEIGKPDVVAMIHDPNSIAEFEEKMFESPDTGYDDMIEYRDSVQETMQAEPLKVDEIAQKYSSKEPITKGMGRAGVATDKGLSEVLKVLADDGFDINGALEWYDEAVSEAKGIGSVEVPAIKSHKNGDALWDIFMGMTSLGTKIPPNYDSGISILKTYLETGKINYVQNDKGTTLIEYENSDGIPKKVRMPVIADMFKKFEGLVSELGEDGAIEWLMTPHSGLEIAELNAKLAGQKPGAKKKPSGITLNGEYYGARILGPKIGRYIMNLHGVHGEATYDIWWTRTWNRWMGTPFTDKGELKASPSWGTESQAMDEAMENIKNKLNELTDRKWNVAEIQAVLWYYEKQIYVRHGQKDDGLNYGNVAKLRAEKKGYYEEYATPVSDKGTGQIEEGRSSEQREVDADTEGRTEETREETKQKSGPLEQETMQAIPLWESKILKAVNKLGSDKFGKKYDRKTIPIRSVKNFLLNQGVSEEEMKWAGMDIIFNMPFGEKSISVKVLQDHIKNNNLQMTEIVRGGNPEYDKVRADWLVAESRMEDLRLELQEKVEGDLSRNGLNKLRKEFQDSIMREGELYLAMSKLEADIDYKKEPRHDAYKVPSRSQEFDAPPKDYKEMEITIPDDATTGIFKVEHHFPDNNIIAFVRFDTRMKDGKKVLFIEEIQSDWHHKGSAEGYQGYLKTLTEIPDDYRVVRVNNIEGQRKKADILDSDDKFEDRYEDTRFDVADGYAGYILEYKSEETGEWVTVRTLSERAMSEDTMERAEKFFLRTMNDKNLNLERRKVPDAPFKQSWMRLAQKRMLRYAVDNKFDSIEWATGAESADMYDIRDKFDSLEYRKTATGRYHFQTFEGEQLTGTSKTFEADEVDIKNYFGKEIANQIIQGEGTKGDHGYVTLETKDMVMGGEFHKEFYDVRVPQAFKKVIKPFGGKVVSGEYRNSIELTSEMNEAFARPQETFQAEVMPAETTPEAIQRKIQDKLNRLKKAQDILKIDDEEMDAYLDTELYLSKVRHQLDLNDNEVNDFMKEMKDGAFEIDDIGTFLYAQHARERDAVIKDRDPKIDFDASGWDNEAMGGTPQSYMPGGKNYKKGTKALANKFRNKFINKRLKFLYESGLITEEAYNDFKSGKVYSHYVPLKGIASSEEYTGTGRGFNLTGKDIKRAKGRSTLANNPFSQVLSDMEQTIIRAEKNRVAQSLYNLIKNNELLMPDGTPYWEVKNIRYRPSFDKNGEMQSLIPENLDGTKEMIVYFNGKPKKIIIHDKTLYDNLNNLGQGKGVKFLSTAINVMRNLYTTLSPKFWITNFQRDSLMNALMHVGEGRSDIAIGTLKNIPMAKWGIFQALTGGKGEWTDIYNDFLENGGKIGWIEPQTIEERTANLEKRLNNMQGKNPMRVAVKGIFSTIEGINTIFESSTRLATYKALLDAGYSKKKASQIAKNITVNFNKKGELGHTLNTAYLFANASIQGGFNVAKMLYTTKRGLMMHGALMTAGYAMASIMRADDEDEYDGINDYERFTKLMVPKSGGGYFPIQLPYGLNWPYALGIIAEEVNNGDITVEDAGIKALYLLTTTFSPIQGHDLIDAVTPTAGKPVSQWIRNKKYHGGNIKPEGEEAESMAPSRNYYDSANPLSIKFSKMLNKATGGTDIREGVVSVSPNNIDGIIEWFGPAMNSMYDLIGGKEFDNMNMKKLIHIEPGDYKPKSIVFDIINDSKTNKLTDTDLRRYSRYLEIAIDSGSLNEDDADKFAKEIKANQDRVNLSPEDATIRVNAKVGHKKLRGNKFTEEDIKNYTDMLEDAYDRDIITKGEYSYRYNFIDRAWEKLEEND